VRCEESKALNILTKYGVTADEAKSAAISAFSERVKLVQELNSLAKEIRECEEKVELIKKLREVRPYHEEFKALEGRKKEKYKKDHSGSLQEYYDLTQEILKWYPNGHTPTAENLEKKIEVLTAQRSQKNAEYKAADQKARELSEASREIEEYGKKNTIQLVLYGDNHSYYRYRDNYFCLLRSWSDLQC